MDDAIKAWRLSGQVYLWRYTAPNPRKWEGWHFAADSTARRSLVELLDLQIAATYPGRARLNITLHLSRPMPANYDAPGIKWRNAKAWEIWVSRKFSPEHWAFPHEIDGVATLELGQSALEDLRTAIFELDPADMNTWDYSTGGDESGERLWLWPPPGRSA